MRELRLGDRVRTARGDYRAVRALWLTDYTDTRRNTARLAAKHRVLVRAARTL